MQFSDTDVLAQLDSAAPEAVAGLPFGVVKLDAEHRVAAYNAWESSLSGLSPDEVRGKLFFVEVAPCTNNFMVAERFVAGAALDETIDYVFTYKLEPTNVRLRLLQGAAAAHAYLLIERR